MHISSPVFENGGPIPQKYTCDGDDTNPSLLISDVHPRAKSFALIVDDPDAPGGTWVHWAVWNIHPSVKEIPEGSVPEGGIQGRTSFGSARYGGPCPHSGVHRYFFKLYALDIVLNIPLISTTEKLEEGMKGHIVADAKMMGTYSRN